MKSSSISSTSIVDLRQKLEHCINEEFKPSLAIAFCSLKYDYEELTALFTELDIDLLGCSTAGEIVDTELLEESIAVLLMDIDRSYYSVRTIDYELAEVYAKSFEIGTYAKDQFENQGMIIMSGGIKVDALKVIEGIKDGLNKEIPMYGGLAADDLKMTRTFAFSNNFISDGGLVALILNTDKVAINGLATSGWKALGGVKTITKSEGNILYSIDGQPALDVFMRHFGFDENPETKKEQLLFIQTNYPLQILNEKGDLILRSPLVIDEKNKSIILAAGVEQGDRFKFSNSPGFEVIEETVHEFEHLKTQTSEADAMVMFSCKGRHGAFGPVLEEEIEGLYNYWKKPMVGFLSYGEIGNTKNGVCEFHNETCSLVLLKEK